MRQLRARIGAALRANFKAGLILQIFAVLIGLAYYQWPAAQIVFTFFAELKTEYGWQYSMFATALFGGLIPFLYLLWTGQLRQLLFFQFLFFVLFWAYRGVEVDFFYRVQGVIFGNNSEWLTIVKKVIFDQLVYSALWAAPSIAVAYLWKEGGFRLSLLRQGLSKKFLLEEVPVVIVTNWLIWTPAVAVIYAMPANLQVPLFNLVLCFFVLLVAHISNRHSTQ